MSMQEQPTQNERIEDRTPADADNPIPGNISPARAASIASSQVDETVGVENVEVEETTTETVTEPESDGTRPCIEHVLTEDDLERHPSLVEEGAVVGDTVEVFADEYDGFLNYSEQTEPVEQEKSEEDDEDEDDTAQVL